jgi:hypothetical protein
VGSDITLELPAVGAPWVGVEDDLGVAPVPAVGVEVQFENPLGSPIEYTPISYSARHPILPARNCERAH